MKKLIVLSLSIIFCFALIGCAVDAKTHEDMITSYEQRIKDLEDKLSAAGVDEEGFVEVYSVSYGNTTVASNFKIILGTEYIQSNEDEYNLLPKSHFHGFTMSKDNRTIGIEVGEFLADKGTVYKDDNTLIVSGYFKQQIANIEYDYVNIKFLSDRECIIKTNSGIERIINDSFKVVYFN